MSYYAVKSVSFDEKNNCIRMTVVSVHSIISVLK